MRNDEKEKQEYRTLDIYVASWLVLNGFTPSLENDSSRVVFCFSPSKKFFDALAKFSNGAMVDVQKFAFTVKTLKAQMFSRKRTF